ncbi:hypothetical protein C5E46_30260 [Nocardia nova]|nr:hypothetical protein C5E46_30260 [Nocardia nova]
MLGITARPTPYGLRNAGRANDGSRNTRLGTSIVRSVDTSGRDLVSGGPSGIVRGRRDRRIITTPRRMGRGGHDLGTAGLSDRGIARRGYGGRFGSGIRVIHRLLTVRRHP